MYIKKSHKLHTSKSVTHTHTHTHTYTMNIKKKGYLNNLKVPIEHTDTHTHTVHINLHKTTIKAGHNELVSKCTHKNIIHTNFFASKKDLRWRICQNPMARRMRTCPTDHHNTRWLVLSDVWRNRSSRYCKMMPWTH